MTCSSTTIHTWPFQIYFLYTNNFTNKVEYLKWQKSSLGTTYNEMEIQNNLYNKYLTQYITSTLLKYIQEKL
jgi:hypothetical protein